MVKRKNSWIGKNFLKVIIGVSILGLAGAGIIAITSFDLDLSNLLNQQISFPTHLLPQLIQDTPKDPSCTIGFDKSRALVGEDVTATLQDGSLKRCVVAYNYEDTGWNIYNVETLDINGDYSATQNSDVPGTYVFTALCGYFEGTNFVAECRTNDATIEIIATDEPPEPDTPDVGDVLGSGGGNYLLGDDGMASFEIQLTSGDYQGDICAKIERKSSKVTSGCNPSGDLEDWNEFVFLDSYEVVWERADQILAGVNLGPNTYGTPDVVGVRWDGINAFKGHMYHNGPCQMNMEMKVDIVVC